MIAHCFIKASCLCCLAIVIKSLNLSHCVFYFHYYVCAADLVDRGIMY